MSIMNINLFSMRLKRTIDVMVILPDEIKSEKLKCLWFYCYKNISAMDWLCHTSLLDYVNEKYFVAVIPEVFEICPPDDSNVIKELITILKNMFSCISDNREDNFFDAQYYLEYKKDFDYTYNKIFAISQDLKYKWKLINTKLIDFINYVLKGKKINMREINVDLITDNIKEMCIEANHFLSEDMKKVFDKAVTTEQSPLGKQVLNQLQENLDIAGKEMIPICQDTGMAVIFINVGQDVHFTGGDINAAINEGVRQGYVEGYLRKSVVSDPLIRENTNDNTPAIVHYAIVSGDKVEITVAPKGFGSENMSRVFMLKPADGIEGVKDAILTAVKDAGPNACPPMVVGVGIGGTFEKCALMAKKALTRSLEEKSPIKYVDELEKEMLEKINQLGIGPGGLGGTQTALAVNIETYPTHIAGLPVAVNICCHVNRHAHRII